MEKSNCRRTSVSISRSAFCIPRVRGRSNKPNRLSPMSSLLDRLRETVFRLIMFSALSSSKPSKQKQRPITSPPRSFPDESHRSEAVADCIEFIKKSAIGEENGRKTSVRVTTDASNLVIPVPVM